MFWDSGSRLVGASGTSHSKPHRLAKMSLSDFRTFPPSATGISNFRSLSLLVGNGTFPVELEPLRDASGPVVPFFKLGQKAPQVEWAGEHIEAAVLGERPLVLRPVPVELDPVVVRVTEVEGL